jgi:HEPN domain-containing protein
MGQAREELDLARGLLARRATQWWAIGFHAQQAAEKALKAVLVLHGVRYPRTHDLEELPAAARVLEPTLAPHAETLDPVTEFAVAFRYPEANPAPPAAVEEAVRIAEVLLATITGLPGMASDSEKPNRAEQR